MNALGAVPDRSSAAERLHQIGDRVVSDPMPRHHAAYRFEQLGMDSFRTIARTVLQALIVPARSSEATSMIVRGRVRSLGSATTSRPDM